MGRSGSSRRGRGVHPNSFSPELDNAYSPGTKLESVRMGTRIQRRANR